MSRSDLPHHRQQKNTGNFVMLVRSWQGSLSLHRNISYAFLQEENGSLAPALHIGRKMIYAL